MRVARAPALETSSQDVAATVATRAIGSFAPIAPVCDAQTPIPTPAERAQPFCAVPSPSPNASAAVAACPPSSAASA
eukprot:3114012-Pleurochrysis_carterae.AAC.1